MCAAQTSAHPFASPAPAARYDADPDAMAIENVRPVVPMTATHTHNIATPTLMHPPAVSSEKHHTPQPPTDQQRQHKPETTGDGKGFAVSTTTNKDSEEKATTTISVASKRGRFNWMKVRHSSDPQLSASFNNSNNDAAAHDADHTSVPPLPPLPSVITVTSPTFYDHPQARDRSSPRGRNSFSTLYRSNRWKDYSDRKVVRSSLDQSRRRQSSVSAGSDLGQSNRNSLDHHHDSAMAVSTPRMSESSRSEHSCGNEHGRTSILKSASSPASASSFFKFRRKNLSAFLPFSRTPELASAPDSEPGPPSNPAFRSQSATLSPPRSPTPHSQPRPVSVAIDSSTRDNSTNTSPQISFDSPNESNVASSHTTVKTSQESELHPGKAIADLFRKRSASSSRSAKGSLPNLRSRDRAATVGVPSSPNEQITFVDPDVLPSSASSNGANGHSNRVETTHAATAPDLSMANRSIAAAYLGSNRRSFGDILHLSQRSRHNSEPAKPHDLVPPPSALPNGGEMSHFDSVFAETSTTALSSKRSFSHTRKIPSLPPRQDADTPATFLTRLEALYPHGLIGPMLSVSADAFVIETLRRYMRGFTFFGDPIDMSVRKLLMTVELPRESQEIDRLLEAFAGRYDFCNPGIFATPDEPYLISYSLLMLQTDNTNKNNKRKMQKQEYVKNTRGQTSVIDEILECFYDNITGVPLSRVNDEQCERRLRSHPPSLTQSRSNHSSPLRSLFRVASSDNLNRASREHLDPYALILHGNQASVRPNLKDVMELEDIYDYTASGYKLHSTALNRAFMKSSVIQIISPRSRPDAFRAPSGIENPHGSLPGLVAVRVAKVGILWRKAPKKKRGRSPWQPWGALLTDSKFYLFRDAAWTESLIAQQQRQTSKPAGGGSSRQQQQPHKGHVVFQPPLTEFKPDAVIPTENAVALVDSTYRKHKHAFFFVGAGVPGEIFLATTEEERNEWMGMLNHAAAFKSTGVTMRGSMGAQFESLAIEQQTTSGNDSVASTAEIPPLTTASEPAELSTTMSGATTDIDDNNNSNEQTVESTLATEVSAARRELLALRIAETTEKITNMEPNLNHQLRNAHHLQIIVPLQNRTREDIIVAAGRLSAKIKWARVDMWRWKCYRDTLATELHDEERYARRQAFAQKDPSSSSVGDESFKTASSGLSRQSDVEADVEGKGELQTMGDREETGSPTTPGGPP